MVYSNIIRSGKKASTLAALLVLALPLTLRAQTVVVVAKQSPIPALTVDQVAGIFLGKLNTLSNAGQVVPVDQPEGSAARDDFYVKATGKSAAQLKAYWAGVIFTGRGQPPKTAADANGIKKLIAENPNIMGYMNRSEVDEGVLKVVFTVR